MSDLRFTIDREAFTTAINWVARTLPAKPINPILGGIRISADGDGLSLQAYDYEVSAAIKLSADVASQGETLVSGRLLAAISRAFPKKPVELSHEGPSVMIKCGTAEFTLPTMAVNDFPLLPAFPETLGTVDAEVFAEAASQTIVAASRDEAVVQINCVCLEVTDAETLTLFATDKHRIAMRQLPWTPVSADAILAGSKLLVPTRAIGEIGRMGGEEVGLSFTDNLLGIGGDERQTTTRLIAAGFPDCRRVIPNEHTSIAAVNATELAEAVNRAILLDEREFPRVRLEFSTDALQLTGGKSGIGGIREELPVDFVGEPIALWVNPKYLLDGLTALRADKAYIGFAGDRRPFVMTEHDGGGLAALGAGQPGPFSSLLTLDPNYVHLVMPTAGSDAR